MFQNFGVLKFFETIVRCTKAPNSSNAQIVTGSPIVLIDASPQWHLFESSVTEYRVCQASDFLIITSTYVLLG